jgi:hypothetical protein
MGARRSARQRVRMPYNCSPRSSMKTSLFPVLCLSQEGGLQIEWQDNGRELELEIVAGSHEVLFLKVHEDDSTEEGVFSITDRSTLQALLDGYILLKSITNWQA